MATNLNRSELYDLVWSQPLRTLAKQFGISDVALSKRCRAAGIPLPGLGYWAKKEAGKPVVQPALPPRSLGQHEHLEFGPEERRSQQQDEDILLSTSLSAPPEFPDGYEAVLARAKAQAGKARSPSLSTPHPIIARLFRDDDKRRQKQASSPYPSSLDNPLFDNPFEKRRLRVMNAILLSLARAGCECSGRGKEGNELTARVGDQAVHFSVAPVKKPLYSYPPQPVPVDTPMKVEVNWYEPSEGVHVRWEDNKAGRIDERLAEIVPALIACGEMSYRHSLRWRHQWNLERRQEVEARRRKEREEAERKERERIAQEAAQRRAGLLAEAAGWRQASELRVYIAARLEQAKKAGLDMADLELWAAWALAEADALDPLGPEGTKA